VCALLGDGSGFGRCGRGIIFCAKVICRHEAFCLESELKWPNHVVKLICWPRIKPQVIREVGERFDESAFFYIKVVLFETMAPKLEAENSMSTSEKKRDYLNEVASARERVPEPTTFIASVISLQILLGMGDLAEDMSKS
jgi:hypothetical protein